MTPLICVSMRFVTIVKCLWLVCILAVLKVTDLPAQTGVQVNEGESYTLAVIEVPGETYEWAIYSDYQLTLPATPAQVNWLSPNTGPKILVEWKESGTYYFTVMAVSSTGCMNLKVGMVVVTKTGYITPAIAIYPDKNPICEGSLVTFRAKFANPGLSPIFRWKKNGVLVGKSRAFYIDRDLRNGDVITCQMTSSEKLANPVNVFSNEVSITVLKTTAAFMVGETVYGKEWEMHLINQSEGADLYDWDFGNGQTSSEENPVVKYRSDGSYLIRLISSNKYNCVDTAYYMYEMLFKGLYIPNAFAPSTNVTPANLFKPVGTNLREYKIEVYDSWGHLLWESDKLDESGKPSETWDGTCRGKPMPQGTYMWKVTAVFRDGTIWTGSDIGHGKGSNMGTVTLIR